MQARSTSHRAKPVAAEPLNTPRFFEMAGRERSLQRLIDLFQDTIRSEQALEHHCCRLALGWYAVPLFGTAPDHAERLQAHIKAGLSPDIAERPALIPAGKGEDTALIYFPVSLGLGDPVLVTLGLPADQAAQIDRQQRARLNGLATIYAMRALPLWEIEEDIETASPLTLRQRIVLAMVLSGHTHIEIASHLRCALRTVDAHLENAIERLKAADEADAIALAARRGWLHLPQEIEMSPKRV